MKPENAGGEDAADFRDAFLRCQSIGIDGIGADTGRIGHGMETFRNLMSKCGR
jgi:hypothetical protein